MGATSGILLAVLITGGTTLILACVGLPFLIASQRAHRLLANGIAATAVIDDMSDTGMTINGQPVVGFTLSVRLGDGETYRAAVRQSLPRIPMGVVVPGAQVPVKVDRQRRDRVRIDWMAWRPSPKA
ncbi:hypothetical protein HII36_47225 [Nonomuraea sp. NN258]|uniref:hypothetical protein n=1 Tax=Nonomuraea antri TaxID=2730852 RepID=UPI001569E687|nr:hypothetical protein [Nonomuraea antri]NRQ39367.1 hypothetical protein [Nonomuraea antri]